MRTAPHLQDSIQEASVFAVARRWNKLVINSGRFQSKLVAQHFIYPKLGSAVIAEREFVT
ncbi:hypothetical protein CWO91_25125 [Bradyrhizobium genosp. SA-3]|nr:hypothetical protein CWO91_25125 [Bradyrhizobium genosp. SA-3]